MKRWHIHTGDVMEWIGTLKPESVHCCITSPPYFGLRSYLPDDHPDKRYEIGTEKTPDEYAAKLVELFRGVREALHPSGVVFLNLGDSYVSNGFWPDAPSNTTNAKGLTRGAKCVGTRAMGRGVTKVPGLKFKDLMGVPWLVAFALRADGWYLRSDIIWHKPNCMPLSVTDRPTTNHEYVFLLTKSKRYFYDWYAVREPASPESADRYNYKFGGAKNESLVEANKTGMGVRTRTVGDRDSDGYRNKRSVWTVTVNSFRDAHFACVDNKTEALTRSGWKKHTRLTNGEEILAYDQNSDSLQWQAADFFRYPFDGELVTVEKRDTSQAMTPNHRCLVRCRTKKGHKTKIVEASDLNSRMDLMMTAPWGGDTARSIGKDIAELMGWYVAEGERPKNGTLLIHQSVSANPEKVDRIRRLLKSENAEFTERTRTRPYKNRISTEIVFRIRGRVCKILDSYCPNKTLPEWVTDLPIDESRSVLSGLIDGDGHRRSDGRNCIIQKDRRSIDRMQALAIRCGYRTIRTLKKEGCYCLYLTTGKWLTTRHTNGEGTNIRTKQYKGTVWCPSVPSGFWLARRNGKPFITGNTFPKKLVVPMVKAGTSEKGCCPHCRAPWVRVLKKVRTATRPGTATKVTGDSLVDGNRDPERHVTQVKSVGWRQGCECKFYKLRDDLTPRQTARIAVLMEKYRSRV